MLAALRPDRVSQAASACVAACLGASFVEAPPFCMASVYQESTAGTPVIFVLAPGVNPYAELEALSTGLGMSEGLLQRVSMGQGQEAVANRTLSRMAKLGGWVFFDNAHLMHSWLPALERQLESVRDTAHSSFRMYLTVEAARGTESCIVPQGIMDAAIVVRECRLKAEANTKTQA